MELRHLRYFVAVAEELHFGHAALQLHVAQSAVSEQIRKLEAELGTPLFHRTPRSVSLTPAGSALLPDARRLLRQAEIARDTVRHEGRPSDKRLRLGYTALGVPATVPAALRRLRSETEMTVHLTTGDARALLDDVRHDLLDGAVVHLPIADQGLASTTLERVPAMAIVAADLLPPDASDDPIRLDSVDAPPPLLINRRADPAFYDAMIGTLTAHGIAVHQPRRGPRTVDELILAAAVGTATAILPAPAAARLHGADVIVRPILHPTPPLPVAIVTQARLRTPALAALLKELSAPHRLWTATAHRPHSRRPASQGSHAG